MTTSANIKTTSAPIAENFSSSGGGARGRGRDLQNLGDLFPSTGLISPASGGGKSEGDGSAIADGRAVLRRPWSGLFVTPLSPQSMGEELASRAVPVSPLLREVQGQHDLRLAQACARRLVAKIKANGGKVNKDSEADAASAGVLALAEWRAGAGDEPRAARVCWRAVSADISQDIYGDGVELSGVSDGWLMEAVEPLAFACVSGIETRNDKAARWLAERGAARRAAKVFPALERYASGAGQRRRELADRIGRACLLLIGGESLDAAALAVGFKGTKTHPAGTQLARACRAVMPGIDFDLRAPSQMKRADKSGRGDEVREFTADGGELCTEFDGGRRYVPPVAGYVAPKASTEPLQPSANLAAWDAEQTALKLSWKLAAQD